MLLAESTRLLSRTRLRLDYCPRPRRPGVRTNYTLTMHGLVRIRVDDGPSLRFLSHKAPFTTTDRHTSSFIDRLIDFKHTRLHEPCHDGVSPLIHSPGTIARCDKACLKASTHSLRIVFQPRRAFCRWKDEYFSFNIAIALDTRRYVVLLVQPLPRVLCLIRSGTSSVKRLSSFDDDRLVHCQDWTESTEV